MREIKIRYYLQQEDTGYITTAEYTLEEIESSYNSGTFNRYLRWIFPGYFVLAKCEYTGCHDKNGREICEGDIIAVHFSYTLKKEYRLIEWHDNISGFDLNLSRSLRYEIIGNIYENPELLGDENEQI